MASPRNSCVPMRKNACLSLNGCCAWALKRYSPGWKRKKKLSHMRRLNSWLDGVALGRDATRVAYYWRRGIGRLWRMQPLYAGGEIGLRCRPFQVGGFEGRRQLLAATVLGRPACIGALRRPSKVSALLTRISVIWSVLEVAPRNHSREPP